MNKNYVEIQGRFSSDGKYMDGKFVPGIVDQLLDSISDAFEDEAALHRLRVTVEVVDLGADVKFGNAEPDKAPEVVRCDPTSNLIPVPEVVA